MLSDTFLSRAYELINKPYFRIIMSEYCRNAIVPTEIVWPTHKMLNQAERYLVSFMLIHNDHAWRHHGGPPPTLTALQALVGSSARQTAAFVATLKAARFVTVESDPDDARLKCLRAAPPLVAEIGRSGRLFVTTMDRLADRQPALAGALAEPERLGELIYRSACHVLRHGMLTEPFPRVLRLTNRDCGYLLLIAVVGAHQAASVPDAPAAMPLSLRALSDRLTVSRAHVGNLLQEAEAAGWIRTDGRSLTFFNPSLPAESEFGAACQMVFYDDLAASICAEAHGHEAPRA